MGLKEIGSILKPNKQLEQAGELLEEGENERAFKLIEIALMKNLTDEAVFGEAVNLYLAAHKYDKAKELFTRFKNNTGKELKFVDFSLGEIEKMEGDHKKHAGGAIKTFKKIQFLKFFEPVEIRIQDDKLITRAGFFSFIKAGREVEWSEITEAVLIEKTVYSETDWEQKVLVLKTASGDVRLDVTTWGWDVYDYPRELLEEVKTHITPLKIRKIRETSLQERYFFRWERKLPTWMRLVLVVILIILLAIGTRFISQR